MMKVDDVMFFRKKKPVDRLGQAIELMIKSNTEGNRMNVFDVFRKYVDEGEWVFSNCVVEENRTLCVTVQENGKNYIPIYTDEVCINNKNSSIVQMDINKYLVSLYENNDIAGLVLNPGSQGLYMEKDYILKILLHSNFPYENNSGTPQKDWGVGIPVYNDSDLMTKGQLLNFAMKLVYDSDLKDSEYIPVSCCDNSNAQVNFIMKKDGDIYFIIVYPYAFPNEPDFKDDAKKNILKLCEKFNAKCLFAPVGFCPCDEERATAGILLNGDGFYVNYRGMELVKD